jgi:hypothetical protein
MEVVHQERLDETFELARAELAEEKDSKNELLAREVERRSEMAQRVVKRMLAGT